MIKSQLAAALTVETGYRAASGAVMLIDERLNTSTVAGNEVVSCLREGATAGSSPATTTAEMVIAWDALRHVFRPRATLDDMCSRLMPGGRLVYGQRLVDQYLALTAKWLLDYFIAAQYADCRIYILWDPEENPAVATFDYRWMLSHARPVYNEMWDNITYADAVVVVAEKGADSQPGLPSQDIYRPEDEWAQYAAALTRLAASSRPRHLSGPAPARMPVGFCEAPSAAGKPA
jgi:hypothetical protein